MAGNTLLRLSWRLWWLPALGLPALLIGVGGPGWASAGLAAGFAGVAFLGGVTAAGHARAVRERAKRLADHRRARHRFLCPACLCLGDVELACTACGTVLPDLALVSDYGGECPHCSAAVSPPSGPGTPAGAHCAACRGVFDPSVYHARQLRLVAVLRPQDMYALAGAHRVPPPPAGPLPTLVFDDGTLRTYVFYAGDLSGLPDPLPAAHALRRLDAVWLGPDPAFPLHLAQAADRLLVGTDLAGRAHPAEVEYWGPPLTPEVERVLAPRFRGLRPGVDPYRAVTAGGGALP